jgi:uncharacterized protein DUF1801
MAYEAKTKATDVDVDGFIAGSPKPADGAALCALMRRVSGLEPKMWGPTIVGFGEREYELAGGKKGRMLAMGFSPRKASLVLYINQADGWDDRLARLGKHGAGKGCLYINKLADVDAGVLKELVIAAWAATGSRLSARPEP